ncbi:MAG: pyrimidine-nucleoside phosphorylase [Bacillota bacterium]
MRPYDIILNKREGKEHTREEIDYLIEGYTKGEIPDYQLSAWAMAVFFQGMTAVETAHLTTAMAESGDMIDLSKIKGFKVDKHSTGGVGDTTTLVLAPLVAAAGLPVAKMSGRGLGHTGGTIDKLESIPGFNVNLSREEFIKEVNEKGVAVVGQTGNLTPADKKLYSLRDVTATVDSIPLIASSIMSKKIAGGADGIVLDVKTGNGAFMKDYKQSEKLAKSMVDIGKEVGRVTTAVITDMNQPLGKAIGNSLEVKEAIETLKGDGPSDLRKLCLTLGANMLLNANKVENYDEGYYLLEDLLDSGKALDKFREFVSGQGGNSEVVDNYDLLPQANEVIEVKSPIEGYINEINALEIGITAMEIGAGRETKEDKINHAVGVVLNKKYGEYVKKDETLAYLHLENSKQKDKAITKILNSFNISENKPKKRKLIYNIIR